MKHINHFFHHMNRIFIRKFTMLLQIISSIKSLHNKFSIIHLKRMMSELPLPFKQLSFSFSNSNESIYEQEQIFQQRISECIRIDNYGTKNLQQFKRTPDISNQMMKKNSSDNYSKKTLKKVNSPNHNFQKHAVVTIKKLVKFKKDQNAKLIEHIAHEMWGIFLSSGIKTKKILMILFGKADFKNMEYQKLLKECKFEQILKYSVQEVNKAQNYLRLFVLDQLSQEVVRKNIEKRRGIKLTEQFTAYFLSMVGLLRQGPLLKLRISQKTAFDIQKKVKEHHNLDNALRLDHQTKIQQIG